MNFIETAPQSLLENFLKQWRYFDGSNTARTVAARLLGHNGPYGTLDTINTELGAKTFDAFPRHSRCGSGHYSTSAFEPIRRSTPRVGAW
jgi:hypothetical protein